MSEKQKERLEELFRLIKENPDLPILPMVDSEIVADDGYAQWTGSWGRAHIEEYYITEERIHFKESDDFGEVEDVLSSEYGYTGFETMSDEGALSTYNNLPWIKAIIVDIDLPEV